MGLFNNLKLVKDALKPSSIQQGWQASQQALANPPTGATPEQLAALTPEQRAAYEANLQRTAQAQAQVAEAHRASVGAELNRRALYGDAGEHVYGPAPSPQAAGAPTIEGELAKSKEQFKDLLQNPFGGRKAPLPPTAPTGPVNRDEQAAAEFAVREAARRPYLAPTRGALTFSRFITKRKSQHDDVPAYLAHAGFSGRPDLVYGVYRVPDDIDQGTISLSRNRVVEWEVVHAATHALTPATPPASAYFEAEEKWVSRTPGEPSPLDEDLALEYLSRAGVGPHECLGIARFLKIDHHSGDDSTSYVVTQVHGVLALHAPHRGADVFDRLEKERPLRAPEQPGIHVDILNWGAVANAVHPERHRRFLVPSPFPHLPSTPQELLQAYLQIVGIRPDDSYGVQVTEDRPRDIMGRSQKGFMTLSTNRGEQQPCADGELRPRLAGGDQLVVVYRDRPEYAEGRGRWAAYQRDVLQADLAHDTNIRREVVGPDFFERGVVGKLLNTADAVYNFFEAYSDGPWEKIPPYRYCWPPAD